MTRVQAEHEVSLTWAEGPVLVGRLVDLSAVGLRMTLAGLPDAGTRCRVDLLAEEGLEAHGTVVRAGGNELAVRFDRLPHASWERLRSMLLERAADPAAVDAELRERLGFLA
jgi:hypothetical protein